MKWLYRIMKKDPESREGIISVTSVLGIIVNLVVAGIKVLVGVLASSIAIVSEGVNNLTDAMTSVMTLLGTKMAGKHPDEKHPFGYGRIEYLTGLVVAVIILVSGIQLLISSVRLIFEPETLAISYISLLIVAVSASIKLVLGLYTIKMGKKAESSALIGVGKECRNDCFSSAVTVLSALVFLIFHISIDAYAGIITSLIIVKAGIDVLWATVGDLLGRKGEKELADDIYREVRSCPVVLAAADMMLHNYGPDAYSGSVNVEIDHEKTVGEVYQVLHQLQLRIMHEKHVTMVFGIYAVDRDHEEVREIRQHIAAFVKVHEHVKSYHAVYLEPETEKIYVDFIVDYKERDWDRLQSDFLKHMQEKYPENPVELTIETDYV